jgi:hypothetical protein
MRRTLAVLTVATALVVVPVRPVGAVAAPAFAAGTVSWTQTDYNGAAPTGGPFHFLGVFAAGGAVYAGAATTNTATLGEGADPLPVFHLTITSATPGGLSGDCTTLFVDPPGFLVFSVLAGVIGLVSSLLGLPYQLSSNLQFTCAVRIQGGPVTTIVFNVIGLITSSSGDPRSSTTMSATGVFS